MTMPPTNMPADPEPDLVLEDFVLEDFAREAVRPEEETLLLKDSQEDHG